MSARGDTDNDRVGSNPDALALDADASDSRDRATDALDVASDAPAPNALGSDPEEQRTDPGLGPTQDTSYGDRPVPQGPTALPDADSAGVTLGTPATVDQGDDVDDDRAGRVARLLSAVRGDSAAVVTRDSAVGTSDGEAEQLLGDAEPDEGFRDGASAATDSSPWGAESRDVDVELDLDDDAAADLSQPDAPDVVVPLVSEPEALLSRPQGENLNAAVGAEDPLGGVDAAGAVEESEIRVVVLASDDEPPDGIITSAPPDLPVLEDADDYPAAADGDASAAVGSSVAAAAELPRDADSAAAAPLSELDDVVAVPMDPSELADEDVADLEVRPPKPPPTPAAAAPALRRNDAQSEISQVRGRSWFETAFDDDYLRTIPFASAERTAREVDFIEQVLEPSKDGSLIDLGCGHGRHCIELTQRGYANVTGFDLSLPLLIRAADDAQQRGLKVNFVHGDFRELQQEEAYDGAFCLNTSFGYFDDELNRKVMQSVCRALRVGGRLLLEVVNRDYVVKGLPTRIGWEGDGCLVLDEVDFNFFTSRVLTKRSIVLMDGRHVEQEISIRCYSLHELGKLLHHSGFRVLEVSGDLEYRGRFFGNDSPLMLILAERR